MVRNGEQDLGEFFEQKTGCAPRPGSIFSRRAVERDSLAGLPAVLEAVVTSRHVIVVTVEGDVNAGNFPVFLSDYFRDERWDYDRLFYIPAMLKADRESSFLVGRLTSEADAGMLTRLLLGTHGVWQCSNQRVAGVIVAEAAAAACVQLTPWEATELEAMAPDVRAAFKLDNDLF